MASNEKRRESQIILPKWHAKQLEIFESQATELLLGGATRGGKSFYVRKAYILYCAEIPGLQSDIFRLNYDDVIANHMQGETSFPVLLNQWQKDGLVKITETEVGFWNGSRITLKHCSDDKIMMKNQGIPSHLRTWEEATQVPSHRISWLNKWVTMSEEMLARVPAKWKGLFPKILYPTNPIGPSAAHFIRNFVDFGAMTIRQVGNFKRQYIPIVVTDNPSENAEATKRRFEDEDPKVADAMLNANWYALSGEFFREWDAKRHVVPEFTPPEHWFRFRSFDWGTAEPAAVYWWAVSDGEPFVDSIGASRWFPRGALIAFKEWYICDDGHADPLWDKPDKGKRLRNEDMAQGILDRSEYGHVDLITLTDSKPFQDMGGESIAMTFAKCGCSLQKADTSRVPGWSQMRSRLIGTQIDSNSETRTPMLYFTESCVYAQRYIPALTRHKNESKKEDAQEDGEATHCCDAIRYACMAHTVIKDRKEPIASRIERELAKNRPTIKRLLAARGHGNYVK